MDKILVIDNDSAVHRILRKTLGSSGFRVAIATDGNSAMEMFDAETPRIVILEPRIPGFAGQDLCREIRRRSETIPILVLSTAKAEVDKVLLLELGADDYVTKPFSPRELLARVRAAMRRLNQEEDTHPGQLSKYGSLPRRRGRQADPTRIKDAAVLRRQPVSRHCG
jgi:two-component system alkaline phosphatase synthesis response regulator PhoP